MLYKTPSAPQQCANCAEVRSPRTALALAGKLSPALSPPERAGSPGTAGLLCPLFVAPRSPQPLRRLWSPSSSGTPRSSVALQTDTLWPLHSPLYRAGETRFGLRSLTFDPARKADVAEIIDANLDLRPPTLRGERTLQKSSTLWIRTPGTANKPPHLPAALPSGRISPRPAQRWRRLRR